MMPDVFSDWTRSCSVKCLDNLGTIHKPLVWRAGHGRGGTGTSPISISFKSDYDEPYGGHAAEAKEFAQSPIPVASQQVQRAGWPCDGHADSHAAHCDAAVDYLDDWPDLTAFAARGRPAVVQGVLVKCGAYAKWTPEYLRDLLGGVVLRATSWWPFAAQGRVCDHVPPCPGVYVFETIDYKLIADELPKLPTAALIREPQIAIGAPRTGAPFHNHFPSMSLLLHGTKLWRLLPPSSAEWSLNAFGHDRPDAVEFEQRAGDIVLVPDAWAHATRLQSTCVSVTFEFITSGHVLRD